MNALSAQSQASSQNDKINNEKKDLYKQLGVFLLLSAGVSLFFFMVTFFMNPYQKPV